MLIVGAKTGNKLIYVMDTFQKIVNLIKASKCSKDFKITVL